MLSAYIPIAIFVAVATGFALFTLVFSSLLHSEKYNKVKLEPYECGIEPRKMRAASGKGQRFISHAGAVAQFAASHRFQTLFAAFVA